MDEQQNQDNLNGSSMQPEVTEPTTATSIPAQKTNTSQISAQPTVQIPQNQTTINQSPSTNTQPQFATPETSSPVAGGATLQGSGSKSPKAKWFLPVILAGFLVLGGGAAAYVAIFQKSPEKIWASALSNTVNGIEQYLNNSTSADQKGFKIEGNFKVSSPIAIDGSVVGQWYESNGSLTGNVGAGGVRINTEVRTVSQDSTTTPDIYMKVGGLDGIDTLINTIGGAGSTIGTSLGAINGQWFFVDHTLIDQYLASSASGGGNGLEFTEGDTKEVIDKMMVVLRDRMFSASEDKAVFKITEKIGNEDFEGTSSYKMTVKVDQNNFKDFVVALKDAAKDTKLNELMTQGQEGKTIEEALSFDELIKELEKADFSNLTADVWVEANGGFIRNVRIYTNKDSKDSNYLDFGLDYKGGDVFPFMIRATMDDNGDKGTASFGFEINQTNGDGAMSFNIDVTSGGSPIKAEGKLSIVGADDQVNIEKPEGAKSYLELISGLTSSLYQDPFGSTNPYDDFGTLDTLTLPTYPIDDFEL